MARIYVASSWRNKLQPIIVEALRMASHKVYDFRNPEPGNNGFHWSSIDEEWESWDAETYRKMLTTNPIASHGFTHDFRAMQWADTFVLVMPCGRSAHLELGWAAGAGKRTIILLDNGEPELMNLLADHLCISMTQVLNCLTDEEYPEPLELKAYLNAAKKNKEGA